MMRYGKAYGGADPEMIEDDIFRIIVKVPEFGVAADKMVTPEVTGEVTGEVEKLLTVLQGEMKRKELQAALGLKHEDHFREAYLMPALKAGFIEMTIPDKPRSSKQKYRLTEKGENLIKKKKVK